MPKNHQNLTKISEIFGGFFSKKFKNFEIFENLARNVGKKEECGICRSRQALSSGASVDKFGFDTAENGPFKVRDRKTGAQLTKFDEYTSGG